MTAPPYSVPILDRLPHYQNARVTVHYSNQTGYTDTGTVTYLDSYWLELLKDNSERFLIPVAAIRLIKLIEAPKLDEDSNILLRPAEGRPEQRQIPRE